MSNSTDTTQSRGGLSRGLIGRAIGVILFLALGTFVVTQSLLSGNEDPVAKKESDQSINAGEENETPDLDPGNDSGKEKSAADKSPQLNNKNSLEKKTPPVQQASARQDMRNFKLPNSNNELAKPSKEETESKSTTFKPQTAKTMPAKDDSARRNQSAGFQANKSTEEKPPVKTNLSAPPVVSKEAFKTNTNPTKSDGIPPVRNFADSIKKTQDNVKKFGDAATEKLAEQAKGVVDQAKEDVNAVVNKAGTQLDQKVVDPLQRRLNQSAGGDSGRAGTSQVAQKSAPQVENKLPSITNNDLRGAGNPATRQPSNPGGFNLNPPGQDRPAFGGNRQVAAGDSPAPRNFATGQAKSAPVVQNSPTTQSTPVVQSTPRTQLPSNTAPRNPQSLPGGNGLATGPRTQLPGTMPQRNPTTQSAPVNNSIPARTASAARAVPAPTSGVVTMPTPGERDLEGIRTPSVTIQRIAPREIQLNTPATFEMIVRNSGKVAANDVRVFDRIPTGTELLESVPQPTENRAGAVQWALGTLAPGQERKIQLKLKATQPGEIGSVAHVTFATQASVRTLVTKPVLEITHSAPAKSLIGDKVKLDIVVSNKGNGPANRVIIQEQIPSQLDYADGFREIEYEVGTLAPGQTRKLQLVLTAARTGNLRNVIFAKGDGGLQAQHSVNMEVVSPSLTASSNGPRRRYLKREATHDFSIQNQGTAPATNVDLMAKLPPGLKFAGANNRGQYDPNTNAVYWSLAQLDPGGNASVSLTTVPESPGQQDIEFVVVSDLKQKATTAAELLVEHLVDVHFEIDDVVDHIEVGSDTQYRLRIVNQGTKTATNVALQVDFGPGVRPTTVEGGLQSQIQGQRVTFVPITSMNPGDEISVAINAQGIQPGEHKVVANMRSDGRQVGLSKEESTQVYSDR